MKIETATWFQIAFRRTIRLFMEALARSHSWRRLYVISPWISEFDVDAGMSFRQWLKRLEDENVVVYLVTRPAVEEWHRDAVRRLAATGKVNVVEVNNLHTKLFAADLLPNRLAMLGSANLTGRSLVNREIGMLVRGTGEGGPLVDRLFQEAAEIYRSPGRRLVAQNQFAIRR